MAIPYDALKAFAGRVDALSTHGGATDAYGAVRLKLAGESCGGFS